MRFRIIADADHSALILILQHLRRRGVAPKTVWAYQHRGGYIEIKIELNDVTGEAFQDLVAHIEQMPTVITAVPFDLDWTHA